MFEMSQDPVYRPPEPPSRKNQYEVFNTENQKEVDFTPVSYHCLGQICKRNNTFHEKGFLRSGIVNNPTTVSLGSGSKIKLFGKTFNFWTALENSTTCSELFNLCRKQFMLLNQQVRDSINTFGPSQMKTPNISCVQLRSDISIFFNYILVYVNTCSTTPWGEEKLRAACVNLQTQLERYRLFLHRLSFAKVPDYVMVHYASPNGKFSSPAFHLVHCHLETHTLLLLLYPSLPLPSPPFPSLPSYLLSQLLYMGLLNISKSSTGPHYIDIVVVFPCVCVKELWTILAELLLQDFWPQVESRLSSLFNPSRESSNPLPSVDETSSTLPSLPKSCNIPTSALLLPLLYSLTFLSDSSHFPLLNSSVKFLLSSDPPESLLRTSLPVLRGLLDAWGHDRSEIVSFIWEFLHKRINSAFIVPEARLLFMPYYCRTGSELLSQCRSPPPNPHSYHLFLSLVSAHFASLRPSNRPSKLPGRVFVKFNASKIKDLSELGLIRLAEIYIVIAVGTQPQPTVKKLEALLTELPLADLCTRKLTALLKIHSACVILLAEQQCDITDSVANIQRLLSSSSDDDDIISDALQSVFALPHPPLSSASLLELVGGRDAVFRGWSILTPLVEKMRKGELSKDLTQQLVGKLSSYLGSYLPTLLSSNPSFCAALTPLLHPASLKTLYSRFTSLGDPRTLASYLSSLFKPDYEAVLDRELPNHHVDIVQCFIKLNLLCKNPDETQKLQEVMGNLPQIHQLQIQSQRQWDGTLLHLITLYAAAYKNTQIWTDKSKLQEQFSSYFSPLDAWLNSFNIFDNSMDAAILENVFSTAARLVADCCNLVYARCNPRSLLKVVLDRLLLSPPVFKQVPLSNKLLAVIHRYLQSFIHGLFALGPQSDSYIHRCIAELTTQYLPRFPVKNHPLLPLLTEPSTAPVLLEIVTAQYLVVVARAPHTQAYNTLCLLSSAAASHPQLPSTLPQLSHNLSELCLNSGPHHPVWKEAISFLIKYINRETLLKHLAASCSRNLAFNSITWFKMAAEVIGALKGDSAPLLSLLGAVQSVVEGVEQKRGQGQDQGLRAGLSKLRGIIEQKDPRQKENTEPTA